MEKITQTAGRNQLGAFAAIVTHVGFYVGWPKAWAVFRLAKEVWNEAEPAGVEN